MWPWVSYLTSPSFPFSPLWKKQKVLPSWHQICLQSLFFLPPYWPAPDTLNSTLHAGIHYISAGWLIYLQAYLLQSKAMTVKAKLPGTRETAFFTKFYTQSIAGSETEEHPFQTVMRLINVFCTHHRKPHFSTEAILQVNQLSQNQICLQSWKVYCFERWDARF